MTYNRATGVTAPAVHNPDDTVPSVGEGRAEAVEGEGRAARRIRIRRHSRNAHKVKILKGLLAATVTGSVLLVAFVSLYVLSLRSRLHDLNLALGARESAVVEAQLEIEKIQRELDGIVTGRNPRLRPLEFDTAIRIDEEYVQNVVFTVTGTQASKSYEFHMVLRNESDTIRLPDVKLMLFDDLGVQVGVSDVIADDAGPDHGLEALLQPGEARRYSAAIRLDRRETPRYFQLAID